MSGDYLASLFNDFVRAIKAQLPNAMISWDVIPWASQSIMTTWYKKTYLRLFYSLIILIIVAIFLLNKGGAFFATPKLTLFIQVVAKLKQAQIKYNQIS